MRSRDEGAADGSLRARGWLTLGECLGVIPWDDAAAGEATMLIACLPWATRIRCIFRNMFVNAVMRVIIEWLMDPVANCPLLCE